MELASFVNGYTDKLYIQIVQMADGQRLVSSVTTRWKEKTKRESSTVIAKL